MAKLLETDDKSIEDAADILRAGGLVAFPTETVYGLGADATNSAALARLYEAKGRPDFNPLIVHAPTIEALRDEVILTPSAERLAHAFWPGPLTLVLQRSESCRFSPLVSAGLPTAAVRAPAGSVAARLLRAAGRPIAAPSANRSGRLSPTTAQHVLGDLGETIDAVIDGGPCALGLESSIVDVSTDRPTLLRPGGVPPEELEAVLGAPLARPEPEGESGSAPRSAPGLLQSHYAPRAAVRLNAKSSVNGEALLGFGPVPGASLNLSPSGDPAEAAANLFSMLHELDALGVSDIAVSPIPEQGLGIAINDRLRRAAAPRPA